MLLAICTRKHFVVNLEFCVFLPRPPWKFMCGFVHPRNCSYMKRPTISGPGLYDPTEVMNRAHMTFFTKEGFIKLGFYVLSFLVYLYKWVGMCVAGVFFWEGGSFISGAR